jgi:phosphotransferase system IIB component
MQIISFTERLQKTLFSCLLSLLLCSGMSICWVASAVAAGPGVSSPLFDPSWRTFARPLALGSQEMLFFQRDGDQAVLWRVKWPGGDSSATPLSELKLGDKERYTAVSTSAGLWLVGKRTLLIRPNGQRVSLAAFEAGYNEPIATALNDGSVAVFGLSQGGTGGGIDQLQLNPANGQIERVVRGPLSYDGRPDQNGQTYRQPTYGHNVTRLLDGRLLLLGGDRTPQLASIIAPKSEAGKWVAQPVASMPHPRVGSAVATLANGRVVVTGAEHLRCYGDPAQARSVDIYDPMKNSWTSLASLPFTPCSDAYGADRPALAVTPDGALVVGGHLEAHVMVLRPDKNSVSGFASDWLVFGNFEQPRIGGVVQAISSKEVVVAGGVHNRDGCCYATPGFDRVAVDDSVGRQSRALAFSGAAAARRGDLVFAAAGRRFGSTGFGQLRYSAYAELIDLRTGRVQQLPNMPFVSGAATAVWLDDERVLVKGTAATSDRGFSPGENLSSSVPPSSNALAVFNVKRNVWTDVATVDGVANSKLLAGLAGDAYFMSATGSLQRLNVKTQHAESVAQTALERTGATGRLVAANQMVVVGGQTPGERISEIDAQCAADPLADCPDRYIGFGQLAPTTDYESLSFGVQADPKKNMLSQTASKQAGIQGVAVAIGRDGRVVMLISDTEYTAQRLVRSVPGSRLWQAMLPPTGATLCKGDCALVVAADPRDEKKEMLFFRQGGIDSVYVDETVDSVSVSVWLWDERVAGQGKWQLVLKTDAKSARAKPQALDLPATNGARLMGMGWHLDTPIVWAAP